MLGPGKPLQQARTPYTANLSLKFLFLSLLGCKTSAQTYFSLAHHCNAERALLGEQYSPAFLTSRSSLSYTHTQ